MYNYRAIFLLFLILRLLILIPHLMICESVHISLSRQQIRLCQEELVNYPPQIEYR